MSPGGKGRKIVSVSVREKKTDMKDRAAGEEMRRSNGGGNNRGERESKAVKRNQWPETRKRVGASG